MVLALLILVTALSLIILFQYQSAKKRSADISYIAAKIESIISNKTDEKLLLLTDDNEIRSLLITINRLLNYNQQAMVRFAKAEISMRKMLSNISHDLKTPLTVVLGYIETIKVNSDIDLSERQELLDKVQEKALDVLQLINKFFDLAKLESEDKTIPLSHININEVCRKNILTFYDILNSKGLNVDINIPEYNIFILGNEEALDRIMNNLIFNAINYGSEGKIIGLTLRIDEEYAYIEIWDHGKGISEIHINNIFERMYTLDDSRNKRYHGSGLGLTITKRLVEKMDGEITVFSQPYVKTVFTVKLKRVTF